MDLGIYTRELLDKHLLPELKGIAQGLGIIPGGNKTRRETWVAALVGQPFPEFQTLDAQRQEPIERSLDVGTDPDQEPLIETVEDSPGVEIAQAQEPIARSAQNTPSAKIAHRQSQISKLVQQKNFAELEQIGWRLNVVPENHQCHQSWIDALAHVNPLLLQYLCNQYQIAEEVRRQQPIETPPGVELDPVQEPFVEAAENSPGVEFDPAQEPFVEAAENSPGVEFDPAQEPFVEAAENYPGVDHVQEPIEFPDLESALAEIARLRAQNNELLERVRSQSEQIRLAKDISPVEKPSLKRVLALAQAACLDIVKSAGRGWVLSMGPLKRSFSKLRDIWDLLVSGDWYLADLFSPPPPQATKPLFARKHSKYSAVPFCDDGLIDTWSLGVNVASSGRSPPGGEAM
jgi:hypothetical protein